MVRALSRVGVGDAQRRPHAGRGFEASSSPEHASRGPPNTADQLRAALQMKISHLGIPPASVRLVSCIRLFDAAGDHGHTPFIALRLCVFQHDRNDD